MIPGPSGVQTVAAAFAIAVPIQSFVDVFGGLNAPRLVGFAVASFLVAAAGAAAYRWFVNEAVPRGLTTLLGTAVVAVYLNTVGLFETVIPVGGAIVADPFAPATVLRNVVSLLVAAVAAPVGRRAGDRFATSVTAVTGADAVDGELSRFARTVGRIRPLTLPETIVDIDGYDPVDDATKERLAGETMLFPRRLSDEELRERFLARLKTEYEVGHVDAEFDGDRIVHLGVGRRVAGIGPTLDPSACAVAVRADPPNGAGPGDVVQVWRRPEPAPEPTGPESDAQPVPETDAGDNSGAPAEPHSAASTATSSADTPAAAAPADESADTDPASSASPAPPDFERVATAELRSAAGDVVTLAVDGSDAARFDADGEYRLVTLPASPRADREFASVLRAADETMAVVRIEAGSDLEGDAVESVAGAVVAVETAGGEVEPIPPRGRTLSAGETLYLVARPEAIREVERRASAPEA
ncbi:potassium transporter TrkA [Halobaculum magnesiiphilum]|uniref:Potassium transporter TrkA n=1 Tax=Halobaculum magnesiiphilum TaxID=1017351 RepID=A0A8T8WCL5_9EURY|nr:potassium transporter TrkA [Halobaculum magnesiiphilum]QZP37575.1 potassium transporter TrkA [Halobaculum magnesiiphilum]